MKAESASLASCVGPVTSRPTGTVPQIAAAIDLLPTLASLAGIPVIGGKPLDGRDLTPLLQGEPRAWPDRMIFNHFHDKTSVRTQRYRLDAAGALFDMQSDPGQWHDIAAEKPDVARRLSKAVADWLRDVLAGRDNDSSNKDDRPFPVGYAAFPTTFLPARDGVASGGVKRSAGAPNCSYYTNWRSTRGKITWDVEVATAGRYEALLYYTCPKDDVGATVELSFRGNRLQGKVGPANDPPLIDTMDRVPRQGESYMKDFRPLRLGEIQLDKGRGLLTLRATDIPGKQVMDLWNVVLKLVK